MKLSQTNAYAIAAMAYIVNVPDGRLVANSEICLAAKMPKRYVIQLMRKLVLADLLVGVRGVTGGYKLAKTANKITLLEIVEAIDGPIGGNERVDIPPMSRKAAASVEGAFAAIEADARKRLAAITLADLRAAKAA